jgi:lysozyme family protein
MSAGFDDAFSRLIGHEGGLSDHAADPGGLTNWGISQRSYPGEDIRGMSMNRAREIYLRDFWGPAGCDMVPAGVAFDLFDLAVNSGVKTAIKLLQRATGETQDGILGPLTLQAAQSMPAARLRARLNGHRLAMMADLPTWPSFGRGWARRIASNLVEV